MAEFDSPWKEALDELLQFFLRMFLPELERLIDWLYPIESLDTELAKLFPDSPSGRGFVDRLFKARCGLMEGIKLALELKFPGTGEALFEELKNISDMSTLRSVHQAIRGSANG